MWNLPPSLIRQKNLLGSPDSWLILLKIIFGTEQPLYLVRSTQNLIFQGQEYQAYSFEPDVITESSKGVLPSFVLKVYDITGLLVSFIEDYDGGVGASVEMTIVNTADLSVMAKNIIFEVMAADVDTEEQTTVICTLGFPNLMRRPLLQATYYADYCNWARIGGYKGAECGYSGDLATCKFTLADCRLHMRPAGPDYRANSVTTSTITPGSSTFMIANAKYFSEGGIGFYFYIAIYSSFCSEYSSCSEKEIIRIDQRVDTTFTIGARNQFGTSHSGNWPINSKIALYQTEPWSNSFRFGGHPGLKPGGLRIA